jgi:RNA polymerase sigma factor (sigma-70 family)
VPEPPEAGFERLVADHGRALRRLVAAYEFDASEQDDLMQEIMFAIWRAFPSFRGDCSERTFVFRIAHNAAISHRRRAMTRQRVLELDLASDRIDPRPGPDEDLLLATLQRSLLDAVRSLSPMLRQTIVLSLEGLANAEIGDVLGVASGTVAVRLNRARAELTRLLDLPRKGSQ